MSNKIVKVVAAPVAALKRTLTGLRGLIPLFLLILPAVAQAQFIYVTTNSTITITGYTGPGGVVTIPSTINGLPVTSLGNSAFRNNLTLISILIPGSVTNIGGAFNACYRLTSFAVTADNPVYSSANGVLFDKNQTTLIQYPSSLANASYAIPNGVTSIGNEAFENCFSLTSVVIGDSVTNIGVMAFVYCTSLTNLAVAVDNPAYSSANGVLFDKNQTTLIRYPIGLTNASYAIPNSVTSIGGWAFESCYNLTSIVITDSVMTIGDYVFRSCDSLTSITIPDSVTTIGDGAFFDCTKLTNAVIGSGVTSMGIAAFQYCTSLTSITIPHSVTSIGDRAFFDCTKLTNAVIGSSVTSIGSYAFDQCYSLTSIAIPASVTNIGDEAFVYCSSLTNFAVAADNPAYSSANGVLFDKNQTTLIQYPIGLTNAIYAIPNSVTIIGDWAFSGCSSLTSIVIPHSVTSIGDWAFEFCTSLTSITIPHSVTTIGESAFLGCTSLTGIVIPNNVTTIGYGAFSSCSSLTSIAIPDTVTSIGDRAFDNCSSLANFTVAADNPAYSSANGVLFDKNQTTLIQYPIGLTNAIYAIPNSVTSIGNAAFFNCTSLSSIVIPNGVRSIGDWGFAYCTSFTNVVIGNGVTNIGESAFSGCSSLSSIVIPNSVRSIGDWGFAHCTKLTNAVIGNGATSIGDWAFYGGIRLAGVFFRGDAPTFGSSRVFDSSNSTLYYLPGTGGWTATVAGRPTARWVLPNPIILTQSPSFGLQSDAFRFRVSWATNRLAVVEACTNLAAPVWTPLRTNALAPTGWFQFSDPEWSNYPSRLYRVRSL